MNTKFLNFAVWLFINDGLKTSGKHNWCEQVLFGTVQALYFSNRDCKVFV